MIEGDAAQVSKLLHEAPIEGRYRQAAHLNVELTFTPKSTGFDHAVPSKAHFAYLRSGKDRPDFVTNEGEYDEQHSETAIISPLCLAVNVGSVDMVNTIFEYLIDLDVEMGVRYDKPDRLETLSVTSSSTVKTIQG